MVIATAPDNRALSFGDLVGGERIIVRIDPDAPLKPVGSYRIVGQPVPRVDLPAKATGGLVYVHDMRVPGMLHGRVVRPPYAGLDAGPFVGASLVAVDEASIADIPGIIATVVLGDFVGVVAEREEQAALAAQRLRVTWKPTPVLPDLTDIPTALRANPSTPRELLHRGEVDAARAAASVPMDRTYVWPYQLHGSIGPSCSLADWRPDGLTVWSGTQNPHMLRADLGRLLGMDESAITIIRMEAAGCYGRNCADDVGGDAALLSRAVARPVRVQLTREQETAWEPKGTAQLMEVRGGLTAEGDVAAYDFSVRYPSNGAPLLASLLTGVVPPVPLVFEMGDRTAIPPYGYDTIRVTAHDMPPIVRASWLRGVSSMPNSFAHESWIDEAAAAACVDPIEYRLRYLHDPRAIDLVHAMAERVGWVPHTEPGTLGGGGRYPAWPRLRLCRLCPWQVPRHARRLVGLGRRCRGQQDYRRCRPDARHRWAGFRPDDQPGRGPASDPRQRHPIRQPRAEGGGDLHRDRRRDEGMGRLSHHHLPRSAADRRADGPAPGPASAGRG